jgi:hypothetical protein
MCARHINSCSGTPAWRARGSADIAISRSGTAGSVPRYT